MPYQASRPLHLSATRTVCDHDAFGGPHRVAWNMCSSSATQLPDCPLQTRPRYKSMTISPSGREQQMSKFPSAGGSIGSGR